MAPNDWQELLAQKAADFLLFVHSPADVSKHGINHDDIRLVESQLAIHDEVDEILARHVINGHYADGIQCQSAFHGVQLQTFEHTVTHFCNIGSEEHTSELQSRQYLVC